MKKHLLRYFLAFSFICLSLLSKAQVVFTSLQGNAPTFVKGAGSVVTYGFSMFVPAGGSFSGGVLNIGITQSINGFASASLAQVTSADPTLAQTSPTATYGMNVNGTGNNALSISSWPTFTGAAGTGTTYYFYVITNYNSSNNAGAPTAHQYYLPASGSITQNTYSGGITVTNTNSKTYNFSTSAPIISYATPQTYYVGTTIPTLAPSNAGGAVPAYGYSATTTFGALAGTPYTVSSDAAGNIYTLDYTNGILYKYTSAGVRTTLTSGFSGPTNVSVDGLGFIWVSDFGSNTVYKLNTNGTVAATITGFNRPYGIAFDASNNAYIVNNNTSSVIRVPVGTTGTVALTTANTYLTGFTSPYGITIDPSNNIYVSQYITANNIIKIASGTLTRTTYATGFSGPRNLYSDTQGNIFVADFGNGAIKRIDASTGVVTTLITGLSSPRDVSVDASGTLYIANSGTNSILKATLSGGYYINTPLPAGLSFDTTTGQITGTPTAISAAKNYTVTAYNAYGSSSTIVNITVTVAPPTISYTSPQTYAVNTAITPLNPTTTNSPTSYSTTGLPAGLSLNTTTGQITGTPTTVSAAANYTITATNAGGSGTFNLNITVTPVAPALSYATPQFYTVGTAITALSPTLTGGAVGSYGAGTTFSNTTNVNGITVDNTTGDVYVTSQNNNALYKYNSAGTLLFTQTGYNQPAGVVVDAAGNTYVTNRSGNANGFITKRTAAGVVTTITGFQEPTGIALDASGNIYVVDRNSNVTNGGAVYKINATSTTAGTAYISGLNAPWGVTVNSSGDLFISEPGLGNNSNKIYKYAAGTTTQTTFVSSGLSSPRNMVIDALDNIYESDAGITAGARAINQISPAGVVKQLFTTSGDSPTAIGLDASGNIYYSGYNFGGVYKSAASGFSISPTLPAGLSFNNYTGVISGTPTVVSAATNYTVTATNAGGTATAVVNITVNSSAFLTGYAYKTPLTLNTTSLGINGNLTKFPVLLKITDPGLVITTGSCSNRVQFPNGTAYDFAFTDPSAPTTELPYQIESYDQTAGTLLVWVQVPTIYKTANNSLNFYYGNVTAPATHTNTFYQSTWKTVNTTSSNYKGVWHLNETPSTSTSALTDATGSGNDLIATGTVTQNASSLISKGLLLNNSTVSKSGVSNVSALNTDLTISSWVYYQTYPTGTANVLALQNGASFTQLVFRNTAGSPVGVNFSGNGTIVVSTSTPSTGTWHYLAYTFTPTVNNLYIDGTLAATSNNSPQTGVPNSIVMGSYAPNSGEYFNGYVDESRVINANLSADWVKAEFVNQKDPDAFTTEGTTTADATNVATIPGGVTYTYTNGAYQANITGASATPLFNGKENFVFAAATTLSSAASMYGLTVNTGISLATNGQTLNIGCNVVNNGFITYGNNSSTINFNGSLASQTYTAGATGNTTSIGTLSINNSSAGTITLSGGPVDVYTALSIPSGKLVVNSSTTLTLKSTATNTAYVSVLPAASTVTGNVSVERYITGGSLNYRGYRLISSPVYTATTGGNNVISVNYLKNTSYLTGTADVGGANGFDRLGNPTLYLFREDKVPLTTSFTNGSYRGINTISSAPSYAIDIDGGPFNIPVGNGVQFFYRGDRSQATIAAQTVLSYVPTSAVATAIGSLTTGQVIVKNWYTPTSSNLGYTTTTTTVRGYNLVGNPYASTIDWETFNTTTATTGIYGVNVGTTIYELNPRTKNFNTYQKGGAATNNGSRYIVSGQGFFVVASSTGAQLIFNESAKSTAQNTLNTTLLMADKNAVKSVALSNTNPDMHLRVQLFKDTVNTDDVYIGFKDDAAQEYTFNEDATYRPGVGVISLASLSADNVALSINKLPLLKQTQKIRLKVNATENGIYKINLTEQKNLPDLYDIWLMDSFKKDSLDIRVNKSYSFNIDRSDTSTYNSSRFSLVIRQNPERALRLLDFSGTKIKTGAQLAWITENESNYTNFTVEKSTDGGKTFNVVGGLLSSGKGKYNIVDPSPATGLNQYRLKQDDINGTISYSAIINLMYANVDGLTTNKNFMVYPNPTSGAINLSVTAPQNNNASYTIVISNSNGEIMKSVKSAQPNWQDNVGNLIPGTYFVRVTNNTTKKDLGIAKFIKL